MPNILFYIFSMVVASQLYGQGEVQQVDPPVVKEAPKTAPISSESPAQVIDELKNSAQENPPVTPPTEPPPVDDEPEVFDNGLPVGFGGVPQIDRDPSLNRDATQAEEVNKSPKSDAPAPTSVTTQSILDARVQDQQAVVAKQRMFGSYRLSIFGLKPQFEENNSYKTVYKETSYMPALAVDYFFFDWYLTLGVTFRMGYYGDTGYAVKKSARGEYVKDPQGRVNLSFIPLQGGVTAQLSPFSYKWIVLSGWTGWEASYYQEVRASEFDDASGSDDKQVYTNSFWRSAMAFGGAVNIRIDSLDPVAGDSLGVMGLRAIYLSPYIEIVQKLGSDKMHLSRRVVGLGFTFESIK